MFRRRTNININYTINNNHIEEEEKALSITKHIIPIINLFGVAMTSIMTFLEYMTIKSTLNKHSIYNENLISIDLNKIIFYIGISLILGIIFTLIIEAIENIKKRKGVVFYIIFIIILITIGYIILQFATNYKFYILMPIYLSFIFISYIIVTTTINKEDTDNNQHKITKKSLKRSLEYINIIIAIFLTIISLPALITIFSNNNQIELTTNNIYIAKNKTANFFDKIIIYSDKEQSVLCNYNIDKKNNITPNCSTYEIVNNEDIIFKLYSK